MALTLEEIKKLPPQARIQKIKEFEEEQKKKREEEEKKFKKEEEEIIKRTIEELTEEKHKDEEEEKKIKEEVKKKEIVPLEQIAEEAKPSKEKDRREEYQVKQSEYVSKLSRRPISELYSQLSEIKEQFEERGYLNQNQIDKAQNLTEAVYQKERSGYKPGERAKFLMSEAERVREEMEDLIKVTRRYN